MTTELALYCLVAIALTLFQFYHAHPFRTARTVSEVTDRLSWLVGGALAIVIAWWRPWFTESWWKAILSSVFFVTLLGGTAQMLIGRFIPSTANAYDDKSTGIKAFNDHIHTHFLRHPVLRLEIGANVRRYG